MNDDRRGAALDALVADAYAHRPGGLGRLVAQWQQGDDVGAALDRCLRAALSSATAAGWVPGEIVRIAGKHAGPDARHLALGLTGTVGVGATAEWRRRRGIAAEEAARTAVVLARLLASLPAPLGGRPTAPSVPSGVDGAVLDRVRALLAKAESTTFRAEAEALSAKAHELMARHAIDRAVLGTNGDGTVTSRRIGVDDPYAVAKVQLLAQVADACRCRAVWSTRFAVATLFGHPSDLDTVEVLHTSLLVQATTAMLAAGADAAGHRSRSRGFRSSFLLAYAHRVGDRLREVTAAAVADAARDRGDDLLPVLASWVDAVEAAVREACPDLVSRRAAIADASGWQAGTAAGSRADLSVRGRVVRPGPARSLH